MPHISVAELQQKVYKRIGVSSTATKQAAPFKSHKISGQARQPPRKELRKQQRANKKRQRHSKQHDDGEIKRQLTTEPRILNEDLPSEGCELFSSSGDGAQDLDSDESGAELAVKDGTSESETFPSLCKPTEHRKHGIDERGTPKILLKQLAQDDAEIQKFEKKLGIKRGRQSLPRAFINDGLDELLEGTLEGDITDQVNQGGQKAAYDSWLSSKRRKLGSLPETSFESDPSSNVFVGSGRKSKQPDGAQTPEIKWYDHESCPEQHIAYDGVQREDFDSSTENEDQALRSDHNSNTLISPSLLAQTRENPYVAPSNGASRAKYVPPSRRKQEEEDEEDEEGAQSRVQIQKRLRGVINRLSDGNFISLAQSVESIYQSNARGKVTEVLTDTILAQIRKPETLSDQFFVLIGGFSAAIYRIKGSSFGSHLVKQLVKEFSEQYAYASDHAVTHLGIRKEPSNILTFLTQLYVFEVLGCGIIFDYLEKLLDELSELNVELLLRVCRMAGKLLRRDDPEALKHVSDVLNAAVSKVGYANISVRTKFMTETIQDLKNSKAKGKGLDSAIVSEHVIRMKKRLGELKSQKQRLEGVIPMGIRLTDMEDIGRQGKWWLVGASVPEYRGTTRRVLDQAKTTPKETTNEEEDMDFVLPDFLEKAKAQGLNTPSQTAIFTAIMSAIDYEHAYRQFADLKLRRDEQLDITRVLVQCVGSELHYNEYYALVGSQACTNSRVRFSFQDRLWAMFRGLGESLFGAEAEEEETMDGQRLKNDRRLKNIAQFYASLVGDGCLSITILKPLQLPKINPWSSIFVEWFILSLLRGCRGRKSGRGDNKVKRIFGPATEIPTLAAGLHWYLRKRIRHATSIGKREAKSIQDVMDEAQLAVHIIPSKDLIT
ncbi:hypothetical protein E4U55_001150 [Claviceps digitariae]|nr:hypothetical protein E4U55_001150 [Claviceps digitariae]